jgi:D-glycerate 3-kinase
MSPALSDLDRQTLQRFWAAEGIASDMSPLLDLYWLPLAAAIASHHQSLARPLIQGVLGGQGTGKTTICRVLKLILNAWGIRAESLSIDDLYKTYADRQALQLQDPRLIWRGPPGTHDLDLGRSVVEQVLAKSAIIVLPQFDKYAYGGQGDRTQPKAIEPVDVLFFEGWFVGARSIPSAKFDSAPDPIVTDADRQFARDMNDALKGYEPLWDQLDALLILNPVDYRFSLDWRWEAEFKAIAQGKSGMNQAEVTAFVQYFWKSLHPELFIAPLRQNSQRTNYVIDINADHYPVKLYAPT